MTRSMPRFVRRLIALLVISVAGFGLAACGWFGGVGEPLVDVPGGDPVLGKQAIQEFACVSCHSIPGVARADAHVGPPLDAWAERRYIAGLLPNEPDNLIAWIVNPQRFEPGTVMPTLGVTEEEARDIAAYLYTLED